MGIFTTGTLFQYTKTVQDTVPKRGPRLAAAPTEITGLKENSDAVCEALEPVNVAAGEIT